MTPDSFSDGGNWETPEAAVARGRELVEAGADLIDVGGESTRPGAQRVTEQVELKMFQTANLEPGRGLRSGLSMRFVRGMGTIEFP